MAQQVISGLAAGSLYALMALGVVMILKATDVANFAQGEMALVSAYVAHTLIVTYEAPFLLAVLLTLVFAGVLAVLLERLCLRPILGASAFAAVIMTLGLNISLNSSTVLVWGPFFLTMPSPFPSEPLNVGGVIVAWDNVAAIVVGLVLMALLFLFFRLTTTGIAMTAVAQDRTWPLLLGISVKRIFSLTWLMAGVLGAVAGILLTMATFLEASVMESFIMKSFTAATIGGFTSVGGSFLGGLLLGVIENLVAGYISTDWKDAIAFIVILVVLLVRPQGLFGSAQQRRV